jgi:hypothetical protein
MSKYGLMLVLCALAAAMLVGCKEPVGLPSNNVRAATTWPESCYVTANVQSGHFDWYQGEQSIQDTFDWFWGSPIRRAYDCYPRDPDRAWPRKNGYCIFTVPHFTTVGGGQATCVCTLYYYQTGHSGSASLSVTSWGSQTGADWPPASQQDRSSYYWAIANGVVIATDNAHATDSCWYKIPLSTAACAAIAETSFVYQDGDGLFRTGWVYPDSVNGTYTDVRGHDGYSNHAPFIRVWYDDGQ